MPSSPPLNADGTKNFVRVLEYQTSHFALQPSTNGGCLEGEPGSSSELKHITR
jgi:hypothetical protein